jgi:hypothetical protein
MTGNSNSGRRPGFKMSDEHRQKIANSNVLRCLIEHAEGRRAMSASAVTAGLGLIKKVLPDLQAVQHSGEDGGPMNLIVKLGGDT